MSYATNTMPIAEAVSSAVGAQPASDGRAPLRRPRPIPLPFPPGAPTAPRRGDASPGRTDPVALLFALASDLPGLFALTVRGHAMTDALVNDGDAILLQRTDDVRSGEQVALQVNGEPRVVLRRIYFEGSQVRLQSANRQLPAQYCPRSAVQIHGRVVGIARCDPRDLPPQVADAIAGLADPPPVFTSPGGTVPDASTDAPPTAARSAAGP